MEFKVNYISTDLMTRVQPEIGSLTTEFATENPGHGAFQRGFGWSPGPGGLDIQFNVNNSVAENKTRF